MSRKAKTPGATATRPRDLDEFYDRFEKLCAILLDDVNMFGYCYTQLTDIYQEQNGIYKFDRGPKFDLTASAPPKSSRPR